MKCVCTSDTHLREPKLPDGDILIHAGDACNIGTIQEFRRFLRWFWRLPHLHKIFVPGNHDRYVYDFQDAARRMCEDRGIRLVIDEPVVINRISFYGYPWTPIYGKTCGFMHPPDKYPSALARLMPLLPDVLITHGPPAGILDRCPLPIGCPYLWDTVKMKQPPIHIFGHVHPESGGRRRVEWGSRSTIFANVCATKDGWLPADSPVFTFDISRDKGEPEIKLDDTSGLL